MYSTYFSINKNFQSSVNLELDLNNQEKIYEYIPTSDICDVLNRYIKTILGSTKDYATTLVGPYGKGKSFLLLVLTYLIGPNKDQKCWIDLVDKIANVDKDLHDNLIKLKEKNITLLPVIINSNYDNIVQSMQIALNESLKRENMEEIIPQSAFDVCISLLDRWMAKEEVKEEVLLKCKGFKNLNLEKLRQGLINYSPKAYASFKDLYDCVNIGLEFNPLVNNDVVKTYSDITNSIKKYGYSGLFVIFDEFSKFIESNSSNLMKDLKIVQDFAELCARSSKNNQIHLCCVTHKSIVLYEDNKNKNYSFKVVEGRFKEVRFNRSLDENYQIISSAIKKIKGSESIINSFISTNKGFYENISSLNLFDEKYAETVLYKGCFPLNPLTAYCLIQISEYAAQNERTLFTFLSDTDDHSFNSFIHSPEQGLFNIDKIYDYFSPMLQKEDANNIRNIWYRTESILSKLEDREERKIIKALSIILMINNLEKFPTSEQTISLALNLPVKEVTSKINKLIDQHYLRRNILNNLLSFALSNTRQIDEMVELFQKTKFKNIKYGDLAERLNEQRFLLPRKHNEENKITRFFKVVFFSEEDFKLIKSFNYYFETNYSDGIVVNILRNKITTDQIVEKANELNDQRVIYRFPKSEIEDIFYQSLIRVACLEEVNRQKGLDEITKSEIELFLQESTNDVRFLINKYYNEECNYYSVILTNEKTIGRLASTMMDKVYPYKLIFNNELINKKEVTTQYQKAINHVIDWLLNGGDNDFIYSPTSPEMSVKMSVLDENDNLTKTSESSNNFRNLIEEIKESISKSAGTKVPVLEIIKKYLLPPYGIRQGVIPLLLAKAISELSDNIVLYFSNKEIELDADNLVKSVSNDKYKLSFSKGSLEQKNYLKKMMTLYKTESVNNFRKDIYSLTESIKRFFVSMPQIIRLASINNNYLKLEEDFIAYKNVFLAFNINHFESLFELPRTIFKTKSYETIYQKNKKFVETKSQLLNPFKQTLINEIKECFEINEKSSIKTGMDDFIRKYISREMTPVLEKENKELYYLLNDLSYEDFSALDQIAKVSVGQHIEDWDTNKKDRMLLNLKSFKEAIMTTKTVSLKNNDLSAVINDDQDISSMATLLKNNIESVLEEFSGSVSSTEKIAVLSKLLKDLL